jgi:aminocarboxymuconate-semialdehyde decarboxylase
MSREFSFNNKKGRSTMTTRRNFLKGAAAGGIVFCSCGIVHAARTRQPTAKRLPVKVGGKRIKTIDVHAHCLFPEATALMGSEAAGVIPPTLIVEKSRFLDVSERLKTMEAMAIDMEVMSINPFWYHKDRDTAAAIVKIQNEKLAEICAAHPDHLAAFASLTLQAPELAVEELTTAMKKQGLRGAAIGGSVNGTDFANPKFGSNGWLSNTIGNPLDTTIALQNLIFQGTLDKFPKLKIIAAHGGGYLPSYAPRSDHACFVSPTKCDSNIKLKKKPTEYLNQLYFDALVFTPEGLRHLVAQVGASQIMLGSDTPVPWEQHPVDHVFATTTLSDKEKAAILGINAARLFGLPQA